MANDCTSNPDFTVKLTGAAIRCCACTAWERAPIAGESLESHSQNRTSFSTDFKGFGASPNLKTNTTIKEHAESAYQFIVEQDLRNLTLIGNSFGGAVSLLVALRLCEEKSGRLRRLILIDSGGYNQHLPTHLKMMRTPILGWLMIHLLPPKLAALIVLKDSYYEDSKITKEQIEVYARPIADRAAVMHCWETSKQIIPEDLMSLLRIFRRSRLPTLIIWVGRISSFPS